MFISTLELFNIGVGPSSSHTMGPMVAAGAFAGRVRDYLSDHPVSGEVRVCCTLKGSLAYTGKGVATARAVTLGLHGHTPGAWRTWTWRPLSGSCGKRTHLPRRACPG